MRMVVGHSFSRGTGQSTVLANLAACLAIQGKKVCLVDACYSSPALYFFYGLDPDEINYTLNDYLWGKCDIGATVVDLTRRLQVGTQVAGRLTLVSSGPKQGTSIDGLQVGAFVELLGDGLQELAEELELDIMLIDVSSGIMDASSRINEPTAIMVSMADLLLVFLRPDQKDFLGTSILLEIAQKLGVPDVELLVNQVPSDFEMSQVISEVSRTFRQPVALSIPYSEEVAVVASAGLIVLRQPDDPVTKQLDHFAGHLAKYWEPLG